MRPLYHIKWTAVVSLPNFFDIFPSLQPSIPQRRREALHREQKNGQGMAFPCLFRFAVFAPLAADMPVKGSESRVSLLLLSVFYR